MSFNIALSGLKSSANDLSVTSNNIANSATYGFKKSRTEFADVYAVSAFGNSGTAIGSGVITSGVTQQFKQGNMDFTENSLDLAISGEGFFVLKPNLDTLEPTFTRAGAFTVDKDGYVVSSAGEFLQAFQVNDNGSVKSTSLSSTQPLRLPAAAGSPEATTEVDIGVNLPSSEPELDPANFDPTETNTYTSSTSVTVYDSLGEAHIANYYYIKDATATTDGGPVDPEGKNKISNAWAMVTYVDGKPVNLDDVSAPDIAFLDGHPSQKDAASVSFARVIFNNDGTYQRTSPPSPITGTVVPGNVQLAGINLSTTNGANDLKLSIDMANNAPTQFASAFTVNSLSQNGHTVGRLTGMDIDDTGLVRANYTNGESLALGRVAMAKFANSQGLSQTGNTSWRQSLASGTALAGQAGTSNFGSIRAGALESSNVDITSELVHLITAQRNYQSNAKSIETFNAITQTIINIR
ncbi:flagellar hook protein FlgE [Pelagibaculum spongiae]|uniref:Flagellar hook protein FlgE n=1 Tax=Pelagibaculum spongiae TaxID=2080658 RepID=A0A2V1GRZ8_9GAMM|nr:flagellar hook protein FlgE [Pelagibaculum spongiae]PVZ66744.1 flagellar hook protein FlgE [Pelagibaculum spongiae]